MSYSDISTKKNLSSQNKGGLKDDKKFFPVK
ncbi:MAG: hypothetical protein CM15mP10_1050 [Actinomycetota bacterium]|nr:MAG: hypothetical protein CM15mP10_1050 [Actinomycetota bacterium]